MLKIKGKPTCKISELKIGDTFEFINVIYIVTDSDHYNLCTKTNYKVAVTLSGYLTEFKNDTQVTKIDCEVTIL